MNQTKTFQGAALWIALLVYVVNKQKETQKCKKKKKKQKSQFFFFYSFRFSITHSVQIREREREREKEQDKDETKSQKYTQQRKTERKEKKSPFDSFQVHTRKPWLQLWSLDQCMHKVKTIQFGFLTKSKNNKRMRKTPCSTLVQIRTKKGIWSTQKILFQHRSKECSKEKEKHMKIVCE